MSFMINTDVPVFLKCKLRVYLKMFCFVKNCSVLSLIGILSLKHTGCLYGLFTMKKKRSNLIHMC